MRIIEAGEFAAVRAGDVPVHVACVMDGNGRWAEMRGLPRRDGHACVAVAAASAVDAALRLGIEWLTLYAFSTENWSRPADEVAFLEDLGAWLLTDEFVEGLMAAEARVRFIGRLDDPRVPASWRERTRRIEWKSRDGRAITVCVALNYGGRAELANAIRQARAAMDGAPEPSVRCDDERWVRALLAAPEMPDVDMVVRTGSESRLSNLLPWHTAYAELVVCETLWPDFRGAHLASAVHEYQIRRRRFGGRSRQLARQEEGDG